MLPVIDLLDDRSIPTWPRRGALALRFASIAVTAGALAVAAGVLVPRIPALLTVRANEDPAVRVSPTAEVTSEATPKRAGITLTDLTSSLFDLEVTVNQGADRDVRLIRSLTVESRQGSAARREVTLRFELPRVSRISPDSVRAALTAAGLSDVRTVRTSPTPSGDLFEFTAFATVVSGSNDAHASPVASSRREGDDPSDPLLEFADIVGRHGLQLASARTLRNAGESALLVEANGGVAQLRELLKEIEQDFSAPTRIQRYILTSSATSGAFDVLLLLTPREASGGVTSHSRGRP